MEEMKSDLAASAAAQQPDSWLFVNSLADCANGNRPPRNEDRPRKNRRGQRARQRWVLSSIHGMGALLGCSFLHKTSPFALLFRPPLLVGNAHLLSSLLELKFGESAKHKRNPTLDANLRQV